MIGFAVCDDYGHHIGGRNEAGRGSERMMLRAPSDGAVMGSAAKGDADDVDAAVRGAHAAYLVWRDVSPAGRAAALREMAARLRRHGEELAQIDARNTGAPMRDMRRDVDMAAGGLEYFAGLIGEIKGETIPMGVDTLDYTLYQPLGVVARIVAFNHPMMFAARAAAALAAGNAVIVKPADQTPLSALRLAEIWEGCGPPGLFSVVTGDRETAEALVRHPRVAKAALVGSVNAGRAILRACADVIKPAALELGGKNALIACADANPASVADGAVRGMNFQWAGQSCGSTSRVFLHDSIHDAVLTEIVKRLSAYRPGLPEDEASTMGPMISEAQLSRALAFIEGAIKAGATLVAGGSRPDDPALTNGFYLQPTVFSDVAPAMPIAREEIFGPVMSVLRWSNEADMLDIVNGLDFGLTCSIWTRDLARAHRLAAAVEAGYVWVNDSSKHFQGAPFGGFKQSGMGREEHFGELLEYSRLKNIHVRFES